MAVQLLVGERHEKETDKAVIACNDYLRMGSGRSLEKLYKHYRQQNDSETAGEIAPVKRLRTLFDWSSAFNWVERASIHDAQQQAAKDAEIARLRTEGLAADHERIRRLSTLADFLESELFYVDEDGNRSKFWLPDVKQIGGGEYAERVDIVRFNSALVEQYRGTLDDIAKEVGGRKQKHEHSGRVDGTVALTLQDWRKQSQANRQQASQALDDFAEDEAE